MPYTNADIDALAAELEALPWRERLAWLAARGGDIRLSTSFSLEDQLLTHLTASEALPVSVFTLDTGRLFEETRNLQHETAKRYNITIRTMHPNPLALEEYVNAYGINGFYDSVENRNACCFIRKVEPLKRALEGADIWVSGVRREHSDNRAEKPIVEWDDAYKLLKFYPLIDVDQQEIEKVTVQENIPMNALYDEGYTSIGCAPCTRPTQAGEHPRAGRWWWEEETAQECGLHYVDGKLVRVNA